MIENPNAFPRWKSTTKILFWLLFTAWTAALLAPVPPKIVQELGDEWSFNIAKTLHVSIFAIEMILGLSFPRSTAGRWKIVGLLSLQGILTEVLQALLEPYCHRHGCFSDVVKDHIGLTLGLGLFFGFQYWFQSPRNTSSEKISDSGPV